MLIAGRASRALRNDETLLTRRINALLPQTQCEQCGEPGCLPYAAAVAAGADCNKCLPGGERTARSLAQLLGRVYLPPAVPAPPASVARIRAADCVGCARCLPACPVDAIVGANKHMHTVLLQECTGCGLCVAPCPVDCIEIVPLARDDGLHTDHDEELRRRAANAGLRFMQHEQRRNAQTQAQATRRAARIAQRRTQA